MISPTGRVGSAIDVAAITTTDDPAERDRKFLQRREPPREAENPDRIVRVADLYSGCGGLSLGVKEACRRLDLGFEVALAVDSDRYAIDVYQKNFQPDQVWDQDILDILPGELGTEPRPEEHELSERLGKVEMLLAGPPCQGHSNLNNHTRREDPRNHLYERVGRFAELVRPTHVIIENVPPVVNGREGALDRTLACLKELEYSVDARLVELWRLGVPQLRKRHVVVASLEKTPSIEDALPSDETEKRSVRWAIEDLEDEWEDAEEPFEAASKPTAVNLHRIQYLHSKPAYDLPDELRPECHRDGSHSYKSMYGRLHWDEPAQTITSGFLSPGQGRYVHPSRPRTLTPHEAARLQFFPDWFDFSSVPLRTALARMIGNAVPMKLAETLALDLLS